MGYRTPALRLHATGVHFVRWGGRDHYFTRDRGASERAWLDPKGEHPGALVHYLTWRQRRETRTHELTGARLTVAELVRDMLRGMRAEHGPDTEAYYRKHLRRFGATFGPLRTEDLDEAGLEAWRQDLLGLETLGPKTKAHDTSAVRRLLAYGARLRVAPRLDLTVLRPPRVRKSVPEPLPRTTIRDRVQALQREGHQALAAWLAVNYLCALRPSEVVRIAHGQAVPVDLPADADGPAVPGALLELREHKTADSTGAPRVVYVSDEAMTWLPHVRPLPLERVRARSAPPRVHELLNRYARAARLRGAPGWPHRLRDSAASHLLALPGPDGRPADQEDVRLVLGHQPIGELPRYGRRTPRALRALTSRLSLR